MRLLRRSLILVFALSALSNAMLAQTKQSELFTFRRSFWINLHQFLYAQAQARSGIGRRATILASPADTVGYGAGSKAEHEGWERALAFYTVSVAPKDFLFDSATVATNNLLAQVPDDSSLASAGLDRALVEALNEAAPLYRTLWWKRHDASNREWVAAVRDHLRARGELMELRVTQPFHASWPSTPIPVDVCAYAGWAGAYTTEHPSHIFVSSRAETNQGDAALESLFHEALHTMDSTVSAALAAHAARLHVEPPPYDLTHALIFFTAADATARAIPEYRSPFLNTVWQRPPFAAYRSAIKNDWRPYLEGRASFDDSIERLLVDLRSTLAKGARQ